MSVSRSSHRDYRARERLVKILNELHIYPFGTVFRLSAGLLGFSVMGLFAIPGEAGFFPTAAPAILSSGLITLVRAYGAVVAYAGWKRGIDPNEKSFFAPQKTARELMEGTQATAKGLLVENRKKALTYRNCLLLVLFGMFSSFMEGIFNIRVSQILMHLKVSH